MTTPLLHIDQCTQRYPDPAGSMQTILDRVSLELRAGETLTLVGRSGEGKSTLLFLVAGLCRPTSGRIHFEGRDLAAMSSGELARIRRTRMGLVFQNNLCHSALTAWENVALPIRLNGLGASNARVRAMEWLDRMQLAPLADSKISALSGGQRRRLGLARALCTEPALILADEPTADLDAQTGDLIRSILRERLAGSATAAIIVTHDPCADNFGGRVMRLEQGALSEIQPMSEAQPILHPIKNPTPAG